MFVIVDEVKKVVVEYVKGVFLVGYCLFLEEFEISGLIMIEIFMFVDVLGDKELDYFYILLMDVNLKVCCGVDLICICMDLLNECVGNKVLFIVVGFIYFVDDVLVVIENGILLVVMG